MINTNTRTPVVQMKANNQVEILSPNPKLNRQIRFAFPKFKQLKFQKWNKLFLNLLYQLLNYHPLDKLDYLDWLLSKKICSLIRKQNNSQCLQINTTMMTVQILKLQMLIFMTIMITMWSLMVVLMIEHNQVYKWTIIKLLILKNNHSILNL